jgi:uncharacterized protein YecT (DUF1311 family)
VKNIIGGIDACLLFMFLLAGSTCFSQHMNAKDGPCQGPSSGAEETACFAEALNKSDLKLNQMYQRAQSVVVGDELVKLKTAQRLWIQFRDANCEAEHELYSGGSAASIVKLACLEAVTRHRTEDSRLCTAGDMKSGRSNNVAQLSARWIMIEQCPGYFDSVCSCWQP